MIIEKEFFEEIYGDEIVKKKKELERVDKLAKFLSQVKTDDIPMLIFILTEMLYNKTKIKNIEDLLHND